MRIAFILLLTLSNIYGEFTEMGSNFRVEPKKLGKKISYSVNFCKSCDGKEFSDFDLENLFERENSLVVYFQSAFLLNKRVEDLDLSLLESGEAYGEVFGAEIEEKLEESRWRMKMGIYVKTLYFNYSPYLVSKSKKSEHSLVNRYVSAIEKRDTHLPESAFYLVQFVDKLSIGIYRMVAVSKIIPYENRTLVVTYQLSSLYRDWYEGYNFLGIVDFFVEKKLKSIVEESRKVFGK
jgi:hypothetical protein